MRGTAAAIAMLLPPVNERGSDVVEQEVHGFFETAGSEHGRIVISCIRTVASTQVVHRMARCHEYSPVVSRDGQTPCSSPAYSVLVVNPYVSDGKRHHHAGGEGLSIDPFDVRDMLMPHARSLSPETCVSDGRAFVEFLDSQRSVDTGTQDRYHGLPAMTGSYTMRLAAAIPDRIGAGGSFHGGGLATDADDSPHLLAPQMNAAFVIAIAENDDERVSRREGPAA